MSTMYVNNIAPLEGTTINVASGTSLITPGSVIKVAHHRWSDETINSASAYVDATGSSFTYTPVSSNSNLLITTSVHIYVTDNEESGGMVNVLVVDGNYQSLPGNQYENFFSFSGSTGMSVYLRDHKEYFVSNTSTNDRTIKVQFRKYADNDEEARVNRGGLYYSTITVMEIAQ